MAKIIFFGDGVIAPREGTETAFDLFRQNFPQHTVLASAAETETSESARERFAKEVLAQNRMPSSFLSASPTHG